MWVPNVPVTVIFFSPTAAESFTVSVNTLVVVVGSVLNDAVTPLGTPVVVKATAWSKPFVGTMVTVLFPLLP